MEDELQKHKKESIRMLKRDFFIKLTEKQEQEINNAKTFYSVDIIKRRLSAEQLNK